MKVYIGPHPTDWLRCQVYTRYMNKKYGRFKWNESQTKFEEFLEKVEDLTQEFYNRTINRMLRHRKRKIKVRIDRYDTWNMDDTLSYIILPMLEQLQKSKQGAPFVDDEDVPGHLRSTSASPKENEWDTDDNHFKRWDWVLEEMIFAFKSKTLDDWEEQFYSGEWDMVPVKREDGTTIMEKGPNHTYTVDHEGKKKYHDRIANGYRLFGKYYESLWD